MFFSSAGRDGIHIFSLSRCKVGAVVREEFPALLAVRREPSRGRQLCDHTPHLTFFFPTGGSNSESVATRAMSFDSLLPLPQGLLLRCQLVAVQMVVLALCSGGCGGASGGWWRWWRRR